ncbi:MAG: 50S ribosomal protein L30 [Chloroflexi bacterium]|nr:50S ribosomal protein L30 [Chloroflexota bacterium]
MAAQTSGDAKTVRIKYSKSAIGYKKDQKATIAALGFRKLGQTIERPDSPALRGMIRKVMHLVTVEEK